MKEVKSARYNLMSLSGNHLKTFALFDQSGIDVFEFADVPHDILVATRMVSSLKKNDAQSWSV